MAAKVSPRAALEVAHELLNALVRDTHEMSKTVMELDELISVPDWGAAEHARFQARLDAMTAITARYRTGASILTITRRAKGASE